MAGKMTGKTSNIPVLKAGLGERELLSVCAAYMSLKEGGASVDWTKFAALAGYSSPQSARICFRSVQKKLKAFQDSKPGLPSEKAQNADGQADSSPSGTPKTLKPPQKVPGTPGSKTRGRPRKRNIDGSNSVGDPTKQNAIHAEHENKPDSDSPRGTGSLTEMTAETPTKRAKIEVNPVQGDSDSDQEHIDYFSQAPPLAADEGHSSSNAGLACFKAINN